jgi:transcription elongation factor Elf1
MEAASDKVYVSNKVIDAYLKAKKEKDSSKDEQP